MAVKIRLRRVGKRGHPSYRIVVADARSPRDGRFLEGLGYYQPCEQPAKSHVDEELALKWLRRGAQPTPTVRSILSRHGILQKLAQEKQKPTPSD